MMRTTPRRRSPIAGVEALETRNLLATSPVTTPIIVEPPVAPPSATITPSSPPTVAFVQFEPLTGRVLVSFSGDASGYNIDSLINPANYSLVPVSTKQKLPSPDPSRPDVGVILAPQFKVTGVQLGSPVQAGQAQTLIVSIDDNQPIKFGIYRFTINASGITDNAGTELDGAYSGVFPTGNGQPGSNFVANLTETHSTILPAIPVTATQSPASANEVAPTYVFLPSTRQFRVRYLAYKPAVFQLAGGNRIRLQALPHQYFPGTYRAPTTTE
jgi:hypothetical protein